MTERRRIQEFHRPWVYPFSGLIRMPGTQALLSAWAESSRRARALAASDKIRRLGLRLRQAEWGMLQLEDRLFDLRVGAVHARCFAEAVARDPFQERRRVMAEYILLHGQWFELRADTVSVPSYPEGLVCDPGQAEACRSYAEDLKASLEMLVEEIGQIQNDVLRAGAQAIAGVWGGDWSDQDWVALSCVPEEAMDDRIFAPDATPSDLRSLADDWQREAESLVPRLARSRAAWDALARRVAQTDAYVNQPLEALTDEDEEDASRAVSLLLALSRNRRWAALHGFRLRGEGLRPSATAPSLSAPLGVLLMVEPWFWYIVLFQVLAEHDGVQGDDLAPWVHPLLEGLVRHPARLMRTRVDRAGEKCRTRLARTLGRMARQTAPHPVADPEGLASGDATDQLVTAACQLAGRSLDAVRPDALDKPLSDAQAKGLAEVAGYYVIPHADALLDFLADCAAMAQNETRDVDAGTESAAVADDVPDDLTVDDGPETIADEPMVRAYTWWWVKRPQDPVERAIPASWSHDQPEAAFGEALDEAGIRSPLEADSLLHALLYYEAMPEVDRALMQKEDINGYLWRKMKRGKLRILLREEGDRTLFHVFWRKDWLSQGRLRS